MQHLEGSGTPVLYMGRRVLKDYGKAVSLQVWTGAEGSRRLRFPYFMAIGT
jgi:hypothetical protein